jgi:hypothetical protein
MQGFNVGLLPANVHPDLLVAIASSRPVEQGRPREAATPRLPCGG